MSTNTIDKENGAVTLHPGFRSLAEDIRSFEERGGAPKRLSVNPPYPFTNHGGLGTLLEVTSEVAMAMVNIEYH